MEIIISSFFSGEERKLIIESISPYYWVCVCVCVYIYIYSVCILNIRMKVFCKASLYCVWQVFSKLSKIGEYSTESLLKHCFFTVIFFFRPLLEKLTSVPFWWKRWFHENTIISLTVDYLVLPLNYLKKFRPRAGKWFAQVHTACKGQVL